MQPAQLINLANNILKEVPFNQYINMHVTELSLKQITTRFDMQAGLIGNHVQGILHGGVISTVLDMTGGIIVLAGLCAKYYQLPQAELFAKLAKMSTIDLHVDYLLPGRGQYFRSEGQLLRQGNKVSVTRMELYNEQNHLLAISTATYLVG